MNLNLNKFWKKRSVTITEYDPTYKVVYLGNVLTAWAKGDGCVDKPLATLWKNYCHNSKPDVCMEVTVCNSGLKAVTREHGLTEYWSNRITYSVALAQYPKVFCWVYRHEGKKLRQELRCHAVLCHKEVVACKMAIQLQKKLAQALQEFKKEKISRQNARLSLANSVYENPSLPRRKILLCTGSSNYRPPLERSKSAPKLMVIEEAVGEAPEEARKGEQATVHQRQTTSDHCACSSDDAPPRLRSHDRHLSCPSTFRWHQFSGAELCEEEDHRHRHRLLLLTSPLDEDDEGQDDEMASVHELDIIEVCFDPMEPDNLVDADSDMLTYNSNDNRKELPAGQRQPVSGSDVISCKSSSSSESLTSSVHQTTVNKADDDTVSDESGYSEESSGGVGIGRNAGTCACTS